MEYLRRWRWPIVGVGVALVVVGFLAFRPDKLFVDDTVDESLEDAFATSVTTTTQAPVSDTTTTNPPTTTTTEAPVSETTTTVPVTSETTTTTTTIAPTTTTTEAPSGPTAISSGAFYGIDHAAEGTATVYEQDGRYVLRFEDDTDIQNGPDLYVWVLPSEDYKGGTPPEYIDLGKIKGNVGGQNYELPSEFDPAVHEFVLIWCLRFNVPFAAAPLA